MKIALDLTSLCRPITGTERVAIELTKELVRHDDIRFFLLFRHGVHEELRIEEAHVSSFVSPFRSQLLTEQVWLPHKIKALAPDFVHYPFFPPAFFANHPFVITVHDAAPWVHQRSLSIKTRLYTRPLLNRALRRAAHIFLTADHFSDDFIRNTKIHPDRITVTGMGIAAKFSQKTDAAFNESLRRKYRLDFAFDLMVGTIEPRKNHFNLLQAISQNRDRSQANQRKLVIVGRQGWGYAALRRTIARLRLQDLLVILGHVPDEELAAFYHLAECLVFPSFYEGFGLPVLEAFACGLPVVCSDIHPLHDMARGAAFFVDPGDVHSIADGLRAVHENQPQKDAHVRKGIEIAARHSWPEVAAIVARTYQSLATRSGKTAPAGLLIKKNADLPDSGGNGTGKRVHILGADILRIGRDELVACIGKMIAAEHPPNLLITANADQLYKISRDPEFLEIYRKTPWIIADGMPLVWVSRLLGEAIPGRINGTDLMEHLCGIAESAGYAVFLFGGENDLAPQCREALLARHPRLQIRGAVSPSSHFIFPSAESDAMVEMIRSARPDILFVGMGSPKQEKWLYQNLERLAVPVCIGVGASFSFISGRLKRAPKFLQSLGLEWFWRLSSEPKRLYKRYLFSNTYFSIAVIKILMRRIRQKFQR